MMRGALYRKKPVVVEAVQIAQSMAVDTPEGRAQGHPGDWLVTGARGEQYFCKDDTFRETHEPVNGGWLPDGWEKGPRPGDVMSVAQAGYVERKVTSVEDVGNPDPDGVAVIVRVRMECGHGYVVGHWAAPQVGQMGRCAECASKARRAACHCEGCDPDC